MGALTKLGLLAGAGALALGGAELYCRFGRDVTYMEPGIGIVRDRESWGELVHVPSTLPGLIYELNPGYDGETRGMTIHVNADGMRDRDPLPNDTPGLFRIAVLGDSLAFGYGVAQDATFPVVLEDLLNGSELAAERRFDTLNFGVSGYSTLEEAAVLNGRALDWNPRLIVVAYCLNDPEVAPVQMLQAHFAKTRWWQHSALLRYLAYRLHVRDVTKLGHGNYMKYLHAPDGPRWPTVVEGFEQIRAAAASRDIPVLLLIQPMMTFDAWEGYAYGAEHEQVAAAGRAAGFEVLDLLPAYRRHDILSLRVDEDDSHPNALAHRIAAEELAKKLAEMLGP